MTTPVTNALAAPYARQKRLALEFTLTEWAAELTRRHGEAIHAVQLQQLERGTGIRGLQPGTTVRLSRYAMGLTQVELGELIGVTANFLAQIERGRPVRAAGHLQLFRDWFGVEAGAWLEIPRHADRVVGKRLTAQRRKAARDARATKRTKH